MGHLTKIARELVATTATSRSTKEIDSTLKVAQTNALIALAEAQERIATALEDKN